MLRQLATFVAIGVAVSLPFLIYVGITGGVVHYFVQGVRFSAAEAAENGLVDVVRALLARGADPLAVDAEDKTPLSRAAAKNRNEVVDAINEAS